MAHTPEQQRDLDEQKQWLNKADPLVVEIREQAATLKQRLLDVINDDTADRFDPEMLAELHRLNDALSTVYYRADLIADDYFNKGAY